MTTYVLGAGASCDAGYPLAKTMGSDLFRWMKNRTDPPDSYAARYPETARFLEQTFGTFDNIEDLATKVHKLIEDYEHGTREEQITRTVVGNEYGVFKNAVRGWFAEIQHGVALKSLAYKHFARDIVAPGDRIVTFNYDVSLERELRLARKFEVGDGYGFRIENLPSQSPTKVLKLHGSTSWLALLFGGMTSGVSSFQPGNTLGVRPVIPKNELSFLDYPDAVDPAFTRGGAALPVMIFPAREKNFYFTANTGLEYMDFWDALWKQAELALESADRVVMCGYSLQIVDARAHKLLMKYPKKDTDIIIASGNDTEGIVEQYRQANYVKARAAEERLFQNWVMKTGNNPVKIG